MNSMMSAGNNGDGERRWEEKKVAAARASARKGRMKGQGGPLNASCTFKGVRQRTWGRWVSEIRQPKTKARIWLGTFSSAREAAMAYDGAARKLFGPNARLNLPDEVPPPPPEPTASQKALALATAAANTRYKMKQYVQMIHGGAFGVVNCAMNDRCYPCTRPYDKPNFKESVGENVVCFEPSFKNLNSELQEFDDSAMWEEAACTMDYHSQAICDPGIAAMAFGDAIGIELKHPLIV